MNYISKFVLYIFSIIIISSMVFSNFRIDKKNYLYKLQDACGFSTARFAYTYTQDEWEEINEAGLFYKEMKKICPKIDIDFKYITDIYDFSYEYAKDSGRIPND